MPVEHEYKFVLSMRMLQDSRIWHVPHDMFEIAQGYIKPEAVNLRVRKKTNFYKTEWYVTFKQKIDSRTIEIEAEIDALDGEALWQVCDRKLTKTRHVFLDLNSATDWRYAWEVDVFFSNDFPYFMLAEIELPEGQPALTPPEWLRKYVLFEVPLTDSRFSNRMLGDVQYATELYRTFVKGDYHGRHEPED